MALYADEYNLVDTTYIVHATRYDPPESTPPVYAIALRLHVGVKAPRCWLEYPSPEARDTAFGTLIALMQTSYAQGDNEEEDDEPY